MIVNRICLITAFWMVVSGCFSYPEPEPPPSPFKVEEVRAARKSVADRFLELTDRCMIDVPDGWRFNRETLYTEPADR